jgi:tripartite motif-containing protein 71
MVRIVSMVLVLLITLCRGGSPRTALAQEASPTVVGSPVAGITDTGKAAVAFVREITGDDDPLSAPYGVAIGPDGSVYVTDAAANHVRVFDADGASVGTIGGPGREEGQLQFGGADDSIYLATDLAGNIYVADTENHRIQKFDPDGQVLLAFGSFGTGEGQFVHGFGVAVGPDGSVYVADDDRGDVQKFDPTGQFLLKFGSYGTGEGQFLNPGTPTVDGEGHVWITDADGSKVQEFGPDGELLDAWGSSGSGPGQLDGPTAVAIDAAGHVFVSEAGNGRVQVFDRGGHYLTAWDGAETPSGPFTEVANVVLDGRGTVYVVDIGTPRVAVFELLPPLASDLGTPIP